MINIFLKNKPKNINLFKNIIIYSIAIITQSGLTFMLISILSHKLSVQDFGYYNLYIVLITFLFNFIMLGVDGAINLFYHKVSPNKYKFYLSNGILFILPLGFLFVFILYSFFDFVLVEYFNLNYYIIIYLIIISFFQSFIYVLLSYYQTQQKAVNYFYLSILYSISNFLFAISFIYYFKELKYLYIGLIISNFIFAVFSIYYFIKNKLLLIKFNRKIFLDILVYGISLLPNAISSTIIFMSDRFFISYYYGNKYVAYYSVAIQIGMVILIFNNAFLKAWNPFLFSKLNHFNNSNRRIIKKLSILFGIVFLSLPFIVDELKEFIFNLFFDKKLKEGLQYVFLIALGYSFMGIFKIYSGYLFYLKKTRLISIISICSALLNLIFNFIFIDYFGIIGVAYATAITMFLFILVVFYFVNKYFHLIKGF